MFDIQVDRCILQLKGLPMTLTVQKGLTHNGTSDGGCMVSPSGVLSASSVLAKRHSEGNAGGERP